MGISAGSIRIASNVGWPTFFSLPFLSFAQSSSNAAIIVGNAIGPICISALVQLYDGSHSKTFITFLVLPILVLTPSCVTAVRRCVAKRVEHAVMPITMMVISS